LSLESSSSGQQRLCVIRVRASVPRIILCGPAAPLCYSSAGFGPSNYPLRASSASTLFDCGLRSLELFSSGQQRLYVIRVWVLIPRITSFGHQCFHSIRIRTAVLRISILCYQCFRIAQILVAIYQFGCRISNTKVSPRLATPDGPVFVSGALCREIFHTYGMKFCIDGRIECLTLNWASTW
jgi:hypothetical protein